MIRFFLTVKLSLAFIPLLAQRSLIIVNDKDGFVNVRDGRGLEAAVIDSIKTNELLYCVQDETPWLKVRRRGSRAIGQFDGYIHKSRVQFFGSLPLNQKKNYFNEAFNKQKELGDRLQIAYQKNQSISKSDQLEWDKGPDSNYNLLLPIFSSYFCKSEDDETMKILLETMWANNGSASEQPSYTLAECYACRPDLILNLISSSPNSKKRKFLYESIAFGLGDLSQTQDPKLTKLKKQLEFAQKYK